MRNVLSGIAAAALVIAFAGPVAAQSLWLDRTSPRALALEFVKPSFNINDGETTFLTATWFLSTRLAVNDVFSVVGEVPFTKFAVDGSTFEDVSSSTIGNVYMGIEIHSDEANMFFEFGLRIPAVDEDELDAWLSGVFTEFVDREEAFIPEALPVLIAVNHYRHHDTGLVTRVRGGAAFWAPRGERDDGETYFLYGGQVGYSSEAFSVLAGLTGRWYLTSDGGSFGETTVHQIGITAGPRIGRFNPALHLRTPMDDDLSDIIDFVWGLSVNVDVNS